MEKLRNMENTIKQKLLSLVLASFLIPFALIGCSGTLNTSSPADTAAHSQYYFLLAELLSDEQGREKQTLEYYEQALKYAGDNPVLQSRLIQLYIKEGKLDKALAQVEKSLETSPGNAEFLQLKAGVLASQDKVDDAVEIYKKLLESNSDKMEEISIIMASLYAQEGKAQEGIKALETLLAVKNDSVLGHYYLAKFYEGVGDVVLANSHFRLALSIEANEGIELDYARFLANNKKYKEAIKISNRVADSDDEVTALQAKRLKAQILINEANYSEALVVLEEISMLSNDPEDIRLRIAAIKIEKQLFDEALEDLESVREKNPDNDFVPYYKALAYIGQKKTDNAVAELNKISDSSAVYSQAKVLQLYLLQQDKKLDDASKLLKEMLSKDKDNVKLLLLKSSIDYERKQYKEAVRSLEKAIELANLEEDVFYFTLGVYYDKLGNRKKSLEAMKKAIAINPNNATALNYVGYSYVEHGENLGEAVEYISRALEIEPENAYYLDSLGWAYYKQGKFAEALHELEKAVEIVPADAVILEHYAWILFKNNRKEEARKIAVKALEYDTVSEDGEEVKKRLKKLIRELDR